MKKIVTLVAILAAVILSYIVMFPMWPIITDSAFDAANTINATVNAYNYRATTAGLRWSPLLLFMLPALIGVVAGYLVIRDIRRNGFESQ